MFSDWAGLKFFGLYDAFSAYSLATVLSVSLASMANKLYANIKSILMYDSRRNPLFCYIINT